MKSNGSATGDPRTAQVFAGGGEMGAVMRALDWGATALGPVEGWPQSLRTAVSILLDSRFPMYIAWGPRYAQLYNDGYRPILGSTKHPAAMGSLASETFAESWHIIGPMFDEVRRGNATGADDWMLPLDRHGYLEDCFFTFSYSAIRDESGGVGGILVTVTETTGRVLGERRLRVLHELAEQGALARTADDACLRAAEVMQRASADVPFARVYLLAGGGRTLRLAATSGPSADAVPAPREVTLEAASLPEDGGAGVPPFERWPFARVLRRGETVVVEEMAARLGTEPGQAWPERSETAVLLPIPGHGRERAHGVLVVGVSPRRRLDKSYGEFFSLVAAHIATAITNARAFEEERQRAAQLAEIDQLKTAFFSDVSHEFRTPLTLILGPAEEALGAGSALPEDDRRRWSLVRRSALRLSRLVNALLELSRIEAGRAEASCVPTDLSALTHELASMFQPAVERAGIRFVEDLPRLDGPVPVDHEMWEKIVLNLLSNALKFTFEGEIVVGLRPADDAVELFVRDTGIGIPAAALPRLFDRFHRVKAVRARTHEGTGIGLALVHELSKLHGGTVRVESKEGQGSTFAVRIPHARARVAVERAGEPPHPRESPVLAAYVEEALRWGAPPSERRESSAPPAAPAPGSSPRSRIVLADDNADMRDYLGRLLREQWDVDSFADGDAALAAVRRAPPDLVLSDVMMPGRDGLGLVAALRADPGLRSIPVILLSARAGPEGTREGLLSGADDYIVKPFAARDLLVRIAAKLAVARANREARAIEREERARLYRHFMQAPFPIAVLRGPSHVVELANGAILAVWGRGQEILGTTLRDAFPEVTERPFSRRFDEVQKTGVAYEGHAELARFARVPGGVVEDAYFDFVVAPLRDADGVVEGTLLCGFEVTSEVRAREELERSLARERAARGEAEASARQLRDLVENLPELAWTALPDGRVDFYNRRWYDYTGASPEEMAGWGWTQFLDPATRETTLARWRESIESGEPLELEFALRDRTAGLRGFLTRIVPLHDPQGRVVRWFAISTNIDERMKNDAFKELFFGILGHDLRSPLTSILTTSQLLTRRGELSPDTQKRVERITSSGIRMQRMIEQLLDMTRARLAGGISVTRSAEPHDLRSIVAKVVDEIGASHAGRVLEVHAEGDCRARVDGDRIEQVVSNLIGNAMTHGDVERTVRVTVEDRGSRVLLEVHNYGPPIDPAILPLLFNPFVRGDKPHGRSAGLGLGLYISERIVAAHGGRLTAESSPDAGTRFEALLPKHPTD